MAMLECMIGPPGAVATDIETDDMEAAMLLMAIVVLMAMLELAAPLLAAVNWGSCSWLPPGHVLNQTWFTRTAADAVRSPPCR